MTETPLTIHVGYHKTATTWMQRRLFVPEHGYRALFDHSTIFEHFIRPHDLVFDPEPAREAVTAGLSRVELGEAAIISSEMLSGQPFFGGRESDVLAKRLAQIVPNARILITIRDQMRILPSIYMQYLLRGGTMDVAQFFEGNVKPQYLAFSAQHFEYHRLVKLYQNLFGKDRVFVLAQERLKNDTEGTLMRLARFAGNTLYSGLRPEAQNPVGVSYPEYAAPILRRINHVQTSPLNPRPIVSLGTNPYGLYKFAGFLLKKPPASLALRSYAPVSAHVERKFKGYFSDSNKELAEIVGPHLILSGYDGIEE